MYANYSPHNDNEADVKTAEWYFYRVMLRRARYCYSKLSV